MRPIESLALVPREEQRGMSDVRGRSGAAMSGRLTEPQRAMLQEACDLADGRGAHPASRRLNTYGSSTLTANGLSTRGLLERHEGDRVSYSITPAGRAALQKAAP